jgi:hypothetical protein
MEADPAPVKLIMGILASTRRDLKHAHGLVAKDFGKIDLQSDIIPFNYTDYYSREMGPDILRQYVSFDKLIHARKLWEIKLRTNDLEDSERRDGKRVVNLDPGYLSHCAVVLATTKEAGHRVYLNGGIYGQPMLYFRRKGFVPLEFTYPDYADEKNRIFFDMVRGVYREQLGLGGNSD